MLAPGVGPDWCLVITAGQATTVASVACLRRTDRGGGVLVPSRFGRFAEAGNAGAGRAGERLVVGGAYRYVRNPMYLAVLAAIIGQRSCSDSRPARLRGGVW